MDYLSHTAIMIALYVILAESLNLVLGYTGLLSVGHAAFFGVGAYATAILSLRLGVPFAAACVLAAGITGLMALAVGVSTLRTRGEHFVLASVALQFVTFGVLNNWVALTGGPMGLPGIPGPSICGWRIDTHMEYLILIAAVGVLTVGCCWRICTSPFGRILKAIREDETLTSACGKNVARARLTVFVIAACMAGIAGAMYATYITFIDPTSFTLAESVFIVSLVIIGGAGSIRGPVAGAALLVILPEVLRFLGLPASLAANIRQMLYGALLVAAMLWWPKGLMGRYAFGAGRTPQ